MSRKELEEKARRCEADAVAWERYASVQSSKGLDDCARNGRREAKNFYAEAIRYRKAAAKEGAE